MLSCDLGLAIKISQHLHQHRKILLILWWFTQLFDWWQPMPKDNNSPAAGYTVASPLKTRAQNIPLAIQHQIQRQLVEWKKQLFQLDIYSKNSQLIEAEYLLNQVILKIIHTLSAKTGV